MFLSEVKNDTTRLRKKTSVEREQKRRNICNFLRTDFFLSFVKMDKIRKGSDLREKKRGVGVTEHSRE